MITYENAQENGYFIEIRTMLRENNINGLYNPDFGTAIFEDESKEDIGKNDSLSFKKRRALYLIENMSIEDLIKESEGLDYLIENLKADPNFTKRDIKFYRWNRREISFKIDRLSK